MRPTVPFVPFALVLVGGSLVVGGCSYLSQKEGDLLKRQVKELQDDATQQARAQKDLRAATKEAEGELKALKKLIEEARNAVKASADLSGNVQKVQVDLAAMIGRADDLEQQVKALNKSFTEYRASSDVKIEKVVNATTNSDKPPLPENADAIFTQAQSRFDGKQWGEARRLWDAFITRAGGDARAPKAQYLIGETYLHEQRYANAIGAFTKLIDNYPKSEMVPDAMFKNGTAFYALKYCSDARTYFQELIRRYPKTEWKSDANDQLKKLAKDLKNKSVCQS
jgi:tol-pal system protein YbgF